MDGSKRLGRSLGLQGYWARWRRIYLYLEPESERNNGSREKCPWKSRKFAYVCVNATYAALYIPVCSISNTSFCRCILCTKYMQENNTILIRGLGGGRKRQMGGKRYIYTFVFSCIMFAFSWGNIFQFFEWKNKLLGQNPKEKKNRTKRSPEATIKVLQENAKVMFRSMYFQLSLASWITTTTMERTHLQESFIETYFEIGLKYKDIKSKASKMTLILCFCC